MSTFTSPADQTELSLAQASSVNNLDAATAAAFALLPDETLLDQGRVTYAVDTGAANAYLVALPNTLAAYTDGAHVIMRPSATNTGASTVNVDSLGVKSIKTNTGAALSAGDITVGVPCSMRYSTATGYFHLDAGAISSAAEAAASAAAAALSAAAAATAETNAETAETNAEASEIAAAASAAEFVDASTTVKGKSERATTAEAIAGVDDERHVTSVGVKASVLTYAPDNYLTGGILSHDTDTEHDINVTACVCRDSTNVDTIRLAAEITKQFDAAWSVGDDAGGMIAGDSLPTSGTIHVWLIKRSDTGVVDVCANDHANEGLVPTLPANYDYKRLIGSYRTDASDNIINGDWWGTGVLRTFMFDTPILDVSEATPGTNAVTVALSTPGGIICKAFTVWTGATKIVYVSSLASVDMAPSTTVAPLSVGFSAGLGIPAVSPFLTNTSSQIRYRCNNNDQVYSATYGYEMSL